MAEGLPNGKINCLGGDNHNVGGCEFGFLEIEGGVYARLKWYGVNDCPACGALPTRHHHVGCPLDTCPKCDKRLLACKCDVTQMICAHNVHNAESLIKEAVIK